MQFSHASPTAIAQVNKTAGRSPGLRRATYRCLRGVAFPCKKHSGCDDSYLRLPLRGQRRNGRQETLLCGSPSSRLILSTEQSKRHLQTWGGDCLFLGGVSRRDLFLGAHFFGVFTFWVGRIGRIAYRRGRSSTSL